MINNKGNREEKEREREPERAIIYYYNTVTSEKSSFSLDVPLAAPVKCYCWCHILLNGLQFLMKGNVIWVIVDNVSII